MNSTDPVIPPPPRAGAGCLGVGCMAFFAFLIFLIVVVFGGAAWGIHHLRNRYSSKTPLVIPEVQSNAQLAATPEPLAVPEPPTPPSGSLSDSTTPTPVVTENTASLAGFAQQRWDAFEKAAKRGERARIELTAAEINRLLANGRNTRGKAFVRIENNIGYATVSIPLKDVVFMNGRYLNAEATVQASADGNPSKAQISNVRIGNEAVPEDFLDRRIFGWNTVRDYISDWLSDQNIRTFRIENNRVIAETGG